MSQQESTSEAHPKIAPTLRLTRRGLVISLLSMVVVGVGVYCVFPSSVGGPPLPVQVTVDRQPVETTNQKGAVMTEVVVIKNLSDHDIPKLTLDINGQYLLLQDSPLAARGTLVLPQRVFTDKRSSQRYEPTKYPLEDVTVTGQLPSGARGVSKFNFASSK